jgi:Xaa-Pro aminopeptidase
MFTMHPTLLVGPADWDAARMSKDAFLGRIAAFWRACDPQAAGAIVYGDARHHAELAYVTHFTPKLESGIALVPRRGEPRLLVGGGVNMLGAAKPLTWVETLLPLRDAGATIARWAAELAPGTLVLVNGDAMPFELRQGIVTALGAPPPDVTATVTTAMGRKSALEMALVRDACASLDVAFAAMRAAHRDGQGTTAVVLAGEAEAQRRGAQDVRSLFGRDGTLAPFTVPVAAPSDPLQVYLAVRHGGYWAEGFAVMSASAQPMADTAHRLLAGAIRLAKPATPHREVVRFLARGIGLPRSHPVTRDNYGHSIGLALEEPGCLNAASEKRFAAGEVYTVRVGLSKGGSAAIVSAMVAITRDGHEVLWRGAPP